MNKAVFLSAGGDPFIASLVMKLWKERWYDEVDKFYVCYNNHAGVPLEASQEFVTKAIDDPKVQLIYHSRGIGNGMPITEMTQIAKEELVMLLEDDGFIFESGHVSRAFQAIESDLTDAVGSPRGSCGTEVWDAAKKKYNLDYSGYGDVGPNYWPNFFFCKRKDLLRTDMDFGSHTWQAGEYSKELDHTFEAINHGDTFVWGCVQLRHLGVRFQSVPQFHASPSEVSDKELKAMNWYEGRTPYWLHGGSLSSGWNGYLNNSTPPVGDEGAKMEIESRVAFWKIASDVTEGYDDFKKEYRAGIESLIHRADLEVNRVQAKYNLYRTLMKL
jgi:hypothetical protein